MMPAAPQGQRTRYLSDHRLPGLPSLADIAARQHEHVPDMLYPARVAVVDRMLTDDQIAALQSVFFQPIHSWNWRLDPGTLPPEAATRLAQDLDLPLDGQPEEDEGTRRYQTGWHTLLEHALTACLQGVALMEIVGATPRDPEFEDGWWRLRRLAPIELADVDPWAWEIEDDGTLRSIVFDPQTGAKRVQIPSYRLQRWTWRPTPGSPVGRTMLRPLYRSWLLKDELVRVIQIAHNKAAVGTWVGTVREQDSDQVRDDLLEILSETAVGETTAIALREGQTAENKGVNGQMTDPLPTLQWHDTAMAKAWNSQITELGTGDSTGNRALGETFERLADAARESVAAFIAEQLTKQTVSRWCEWNGLIPDRAPEVRVNRPSAPALPVTIDAATPVLEPAPGPVAAARDTDDNTPVRGVPQAVRPLTPEERASRLDFAAIHGAWTSLRDWLIEQWRTVRATMIQAGASTLSRVRDLDNRLDQVADLVRTAALATLDPDQQTMIARRLADAADEAARQIQSAARAAGLDPAPLEVAYRDRALREVRSIGQELGYTTAGQFQRRAQDLATLGADEASAQIASQLEELTDAQLSDIAGGQSTRAQHAGQFEAYRQAEESGEIRDIYYSSVLDGRTCGPCSQADGREYRSLAEAAVDFPSSGYRDCEGGPRCRCMPIIVWASEQDVAVR